MTGVAENPTSICVSNFLKSNRVLDKYLEAVADNSTCETLSDLVSPEANASRQQAFAMLSKIVSLNFIQNVHADEIYELLSNCFRWTNGHEQQAVITVGFGASEDAPSPRLCSYLSGAVELHSLLTQYHREGWIASAPQLRLLFAHKLGSSLNQLSADATADTAIESAKLLHAFLDRFHPDTLKATQFMSDGQLDYSAVSEHTTAFLDRIAGTKLHSKLQKQAERMVSKGLLGDHSDSLLRCANYAISHALIFQDFVDPGLSPSSDSKVFFSYGGKGEVLFAEVRREFIRFLSEVSDTSLHFPSSIRVIQTNGQYPPYYHVEGVDTKVSSLSTDSELIQTSNIGDKALKKEAIKDKYALRWLAGCNYTEACLDQSASTQMVDAKLKDFFLDQTSVAQQGTVL